MSWDHDFVVSGGDVVFGPCIFGPWEQFVRIWGLGVAGFVRNFPGGDFISGDAGLRVRKIEPITKKIITAPTQFSFDTFWSVVPKRHLPTGPVPRPRSVFMSCLSFTIRGRERQV